MQKCFAALPSSLSYKAYFYMQRRFGSLKNATPLDRLHVCVDILSQITGQNRSYTGKTFFEVGTGWRLVVPIGLWLCGAGEIITVDKNPYLSGELVLRDIAFIRANPDKIKSVLAQFAGSDFDVRLSKLCEIRGLKELFSLTGIRYTPQGDASDTALAAGSIDFHFSYAVFEHIEPQVIANIANEFVRISKKDALFIHGIDFTDHFSHKDTSITSINFLQFSQRQWDIYAGNRYMYHNRLRIDELTDLLSRCRLKILDSRVTVDERALEQLRHNKIVLDERFRSKSSEINAASKAWLTASVSGV